MKRIPILALVCLYALSVFGQGTQHDRVRAIQFLNRSIITLNGPTPSVANGNLFVTANAANTTISNFTNGIDTQEITVNCGDTLTVIASNSSIVTASGSAFTCSTTNISISFFYDAGQGKWIQKGGTGSGGGTSTAAGIAGSVSLVAGSAIVSLPPIFATAPICIAEDITTIATVQCATTTSAATFTGTGTDTVKYLIQGTGFFGGSSGTGSTPAFPFNSVQYNNAGTLGGAGLNYYPSSDPNWGVNTLTNLDESGTVSSGLFDIQLHGSTVSSQTFISGDQIELNSVIAPATGQTSHAFTSTALSGGVNSNTEGAYAVVDNYPGTNTGASWFGVLSQAQLSANNNGSVAGTTLANFYTVANGGRSDAHVDNYHGILFSDMGAIGGQSDSIYSNVEQSVIKIKAQTATRAGGAQYAIKVDSGAGTSQFDSTVQFNAGMKDSAGSLGTAGYVWTTDGSVNLWAPAGSGSGSVTSVFGRTGAVAAATNDYSFSQISGSLGHGQLPTLLSADIPNNAANTTGSASKVGGIAITGTPSVGQVPVATSTSAATWQNTVSTLSVGDLSPLFTSSVATATTTPAVTYALSTAAAHKVFMNNTGSTAAPGFQSIGTADLPAIPLTTGVIGILPIANGGSGSATPSLVAGTNVTITGSWPNQTITSSATAATAWSAVTAATNSNAGTFAMTGNTLDLAGTTLVKLRVGAGTATTVNGDVAYDTTNKNWHLWANGVDNFGLLLPVSITPTTGDCAKFTLTAGVITLNTAGQACITSTGTLTSGRILIANGAQTVTPLGSAGAATTLLHGGSPPVFGAVALATDVSGLLPVANGGTGTATPSLVAGSNITVTGSWPNQTVTATGSAPTAFNTLTNGTNTTAAMVVGTGASLTVSGSGTNNATSVGGITLTGTPSIGQVPVATSTSAGTWQNVPAVTSVNSGNLSPLFTTSVATGTTTPVISYALSTFAAHKFYGNPSGSTAAPSAASITTADLPAIPLASGVSGLLPVANGGTGTATPSLICGTNCSSITGTWPNQTINVANTAGTAFSSLTASTNTGQAFLLGAGSSLDVTGGGTNNATALGGVTASGVPAVGQTLQATSTTTAAWQSPITISRATIGVGNCASGVAATWWNTSLVAACRTGSNVIEAILPFADGNVAQIPMALDLPADWVGAIDVRAIFSSASTSGTVIWNVQTACAPVNGSATDDTAFNAVQAMGTITLSGTASAQWAASKTGVTTTGCTAGSTLMLKISRATDTAAGVANLKNIEVTIRKSNLL